MSFKAFDYSVAMICYQKNGKKYGMSCAWAMQADYDKLLCLLGSQSDTGKHLVSGDRVGVSTASIHQKATVFQLGDNHSGETDKFKGLDIIEKNGAILIQGSSRMMVCEVIDVLHLKGIEEDNLLYLRVLESVEGNEDFLHYGDL